MTILRFADRPQLPKTDICVVGAGPVGIALALACEARGLSVLLLDSGGMIADAWSASLSAAIIQTPHAHAAMDVAVRRGLGGTSHWWGGRCVPFDDVDFARRSWSGEEGWPLTHDDVRRWYPAAADFFDCGPPVFHRPRAGNLGGLGVDDARLERWSPQIDMYRRHATSLIHSPKITVVHGATVTDLHFVQQGCNISSIEVADQAGVETVPVERCVIACGGLETTRLLLVAQRNNPKAFGGPDGPLGRFYMGHLSGKIAQIVFNDKATVRDFDFLLEDGAYIRRRYTLLDANLLEENLQNIAMWVDNPPFCDAAHRSGLLSAVWLALSVPQIGRLCAPEAVRLAHVGPAPYEIWPHIANLGRAPGATLAGAWNILQERFIRQPRKPGFVVPNEGARYALHFHAEQRPNERSRVMLADSTDALGMPRLSIDFRFDETDADSVVRSHELLDHALRSSREGRLDYLVPHSERSGLALRKSSDGFHQIGTTRMAVSSRVGVVDENCRVHGSPNLFIASSSVFPSSSQANPTFLAVALAVRLAEFLASEGRRSSRLVDEALN